MNVWGISRKGFLQPCCPSCHSTNCVKAAKKRQSTDDKPVAWPGLPFLHPPTTSCRKGRCSICVAPALRRQHPFALTICLYFSVPDILVSTANTDELIEMLFGVWTRVQGPNIRHGNGHFVGHTWAMCMPAVDTLNVIRVGQRARFGFSLPVR